MAKRLPPDMEERIVALKKQGLADQTIADQVGCARRTVGMVVARNTQQHEPVSLPGAGQPLTSNAVLARLERHRDKMLALVDSAIERCAREITSGRATQDVSRTITTLSGQAVTLEKHIRNLGGLPTKVPTSEAAKERLRKQLLLRQATGGSVRATCELSKALGLSDQQQEALTVIFEDVGCSDDNPVGGSDDNPGDG